MCLVSSLFLLMSRFLIAIAAPAPVYPDGKVCISILHPPEADPMNPQELLSEKWRPIISVRDASTFFKCFCVISVFFAVFFATLYIGFLFLFFGWGLSVSQVEGILVSVVSMLDAPNHDSPANIDASVRVFPPLLTHACCCY
jgi:ubiquitin-conjugating enzyme E2 G1